MPKVEIGPDGTPRVVPDDKETTTTLNTPSTPGSPTTATFVVGTENKEENKSEEKQNEETTKGTTTIPETIKVPPMKNEPAGMDKRIEDAKLFNDKLANKGVVQPMTQVTVAVNKDTELRTILKRYGMDSQQQEKAFAEIKSLFA